MADATIHRKGLPHGAPESADRLDADRLNATLAGTVFAGGLRHFAQIDSTNAHALGEAQAGAPEGSVYLADEQTAGRGRGLHAWHSEPCSGLYLSALLRPRLSPADALWLSLAAGLAVQEAVARVTGLDADLRWPNDLLLGGRKFCGILTELNAEAARVRHAVVGIGVNVNHAAFPGELRSLATSLRIETGRHWPRTDLAGALLVALDREYRLILEEREAGRPAGASLLGRFETRSTWARGKRVRVAEAGGYTGVTDGLDERGFLRVRTADGVRTVLSGGVREFVAGNDG